jgi:hypothetical protein
VPIALKHVYIVPIHDTHSQENPQQSIERQLLHGIMLPITCPKLSAPSLAKNDPVVPARRGTFAAVVGYRDKRTRDFATGKRVKAFSGIERPSRLRLDRLEAAIAPMCRPTASQAF